MVFFGEGEDCGVGDTGFGLDGHFRFAVAEEEELISEEKVIRAGSLREVVDPYLSGAFIVMCLANEWWVRREGR